jgi:hypothetical protein
MDETAFNVAWQANPTDYSRVGNHQPGTTNANANAETLVVCQS